MNIPGYDNWKLLSPYDFEDGCAVECERCRGEFHEDDIRDFEGQMVCLECERKLEEQLLENN